jgi:hypothetical protein
MGNLLSTELYGVRKERNKGMAFGQYKTPIGVGVWA